VEAMRLIHRATGHESTHFPLTRENVYSCDSWTIIDNDLDQGKHG